ncbi:unnamed protein product [Rotaria sp. Silwood1]|nr:unnamed protein product [Rotaria sp. Silwood1]
MSRICGNSRVICIFISSLFEFERATSKLRLSPLIKRFKARRSNFCFVVSVVRARDLLSLFSEILLSDLLPLCSQLLVSSNVDEFSLFSLCILNELLNELKLIDCVLPIHIQNDIKQELYQTFLPIICDKHILREEPISILSLRFIQTLWTLIDHTSSSFSILSQSNLISNLFNLIIQNKDKSTGTFVQGIVSCLTTLSEKREILQTMIEQGK